MNIYDREFWKTPIIFLSRRQRILGYFLVFGLLILLCVIIGGVAAARLYYGG